MRVRSLAPVMLVFGIVLVLAGCAAMPGQVRGGPPAGPIIVVDPDPEPSGPAMQCKDQTQPCWYVGSFDSAHYEYLPDHVAYMDGTTEDPPKVPHYLNHTATVHSMQIRLKDGKRIEISKVEFTLASGKKLEIEVASPDVVPLWSYGGERMRGKHVGGSRKKLPQLVMDKITAVSVTERANQPAHDPVTIANLDQFRMYYNQ